jgi:hypothetical protein
VLPGGRVTRRRLNLFARSADTQNCGERLRWALFERVQELGRQLKVILLGLAFTIVAAGFAYAVPRTVELSLTPSSPAENPEGASKPEGIQPVDPGRASSSFPIDRALPKRAASGKPRRGRGRKLGHLQVSRVDDKERLLRRWKEWESSDQSAPSLVRALP